MNLHIFFSPAEALAINPAPNDIYIIIDVIRATTSLTVIFEQGAARTFIAETVEQAREAAHGVPGRLLCGERNVQALPGFDYGNSPAQFAQANLQGRELILSTTNGTRAFFACPEHSIRLAGCFYNAQAVTAYALTCARERGSNIGIVCAAEHGYFALDDATCAGYLALELQHQQPSITIHESVRAAVALYQAYPPPGLIDYCNSAQKVIEGGLQQDLEICMHIDGSTSVPHVVGKEHKTGLLILEHT